MRLVVALGGNALGNTPVEQLDLVRIAAKSIVDLVEAGNEVIVSHGNGPQVGMIKNAFDIASGIDSSIASMPLPECDALSQGYIGYHLQTAIHQQLHKRKINKNVVSLVTQVLVDEKDRAFTNPTKPIGSFVNKQKAEILSSQGAIMKDFGLKGFRQVVASPKPIDIIEKDVVRQLVPTSVVITVGGGGIPVINTTDGLRGVNAVIDKDFASAKLGELINADKLIILTAVDKICINFEKPDQKELDTLTISQANKYIEEGQFGSGSMLPKVQAAINFVTSGKNKQAIIAALENVALAIEGKSGTVILAD